MKALFFVLVSMSFFLPLGACSRNILVKGNVLHVGQSIVATNRYGTVKISYVSPNKRKYEWDGKSRIVQMRAREEPFDGEIGLYEPADAFGPNLFRVRLVVRESVMDFQDISQIHAFLGSGSAAMDWVYTNDGLVVGFGRAPERQQINIDLYQILLRGAKPNDLTGKGQDTIHLFDSKSNR